MAHYRFNRHQLFSQEDTSEVMNIIRTVEDIAIDNDSYMEGSFGDLTNMLYGLFDGYLYDNILTTAAGIAKLPMDVIRRIEAKVDMIVLHILAQGESETNVF